MEDDAPTPTPPPTPGGSGKRPDAVTGRGQVRAFGVVPSRSQPGLGEEHQLCVVVGDEGANVWSFLGTSVEESDGNIVGESIGLVCRRIEIKLLKFTGEDRYRFLLLLLLFCCCWLLLLLLLLFLGGLLVVVVLMVVFFCLFVCLNQSGIRNRKILSSVGRLFVRFFPPRRKRYVVVKKADVKFSKTRGQVRGQVSR